MKKKKILIPGIMLLALLAGCGKAAGSPGQLTPIPLKDSSGQEPGGASPGGISDETGTGTTEGMPGDGKESTQGEGAEGGGSAEGIQQAAQSEEPGQDGKTGTEFGFGALGSRYFYFSSGAGGWSTELRIQRDGTFTGNYHDSDMGSTGEGYPDGTIYYCVFTGRFGGLEKVDDFTYKMKLVSLTLDEEPETVNIEDGICWIASTANGLDGGEEFCLYLPGSELASLPEGYLQWVGYFDLDNVQETTLPYYGLYNVNTGEGFSSFEYEEQSLSERIAAEIALANENAASLEAKLQEDITQAEMDDASGELFRIWDAALNNVWGMLESGLDVEKMAALREEEREWIAHKEEAVKAAGMEYEGGSMQSAAESLKAAELTKERVQALAVYAE